MLKGVVDGKISGNPIYQCNGYDKLSLENERRENA